MTPDNSIETIGLFGLGAFGRLILRNLGPLCRVLAHDPRAEASDPALAGVTLQGLPHVARCDLVILAVPVAEMRPVLRAIAPHLRPGSIVADVGSVKLAPVQAMQDLLPPHVEIVGTHPLFGPQSAGAGLAGRKIAVCPVRGRAHLRLAALLRRHLGLQVRIVSAAAHDRELAVVQGLTHFIARVMTGFDPMPARLTTVSYERLQEAIVMVRDDPPGVFHAIERDNPFAGPVRHRFMDLAGELSRELARKAQADR